MALVLVLGIAAFQFSSQPKVGEQVYTLKHNQVGRRAEVQLMCQPMRNTNGPHVDYASAEVTQGINSGDLEKDLHRMLVTITAPDGRCTVFEIGQGKQAIQLLDAIAKKHPEYKGLVAAAKVAGVQCNMAPVKVAVGNKMIADLQANDDVGIHITQSQTDTSHLVLDFSSYLLTMHFTMQTGYQEFTASDSGSEVVAVKADGCAVAFTTTSIFSSDSSNRQLVRFFSAEHSLVFPEVADESAKLTEARQLTLEAFKQLHPDAMSAGAGAGCGAGSGSARPTLSASLTPRSGTSPYASDSEAEDGLGPRPGLVIFGEGAQHQNDITMI